tara:strand:- start:24990 stop:25868 length:879 start_codon:yes stop_codon:yes gene_type:complete
MKQKKMRFRKTIIIFTICSLFIACERDIDLNLPTEEVALVLEGGLTNENEVWQIKLSESAPYYSNSYPPIKDALVMITHGNEIDTLYQTDPGMYQTIDKKQGLVGESYTLTIKWKGNSYTATEMLHDQLPLDTVAAFYLAMDNGFIEEGWYAFIGADEIQGKRDRDYYEWKVFINDTLYEENGILIDTDEFRDVGFWNILIDPNNPLAQQKEGILPRPIVSDFTEGDTVRIEQYAISKNYYDFLFGLQNLQNSGGPFSSPASNPPSNIVSSKTAYGYFRVAHKVGGMVVIEE